MFYLMMHSTLYIFGYLVSNILKTIQIIKRKSAATTWAALFPVSNQIFFLICAM